MLWIKFVVSALVIILAGSRLSRYGDIIAEKTGLGGSLVGVVLMASVTSLPELVTGVSAVMFVGAPDIAVGDILGSCVFNLFILAALLDAIHKPAPITTTAHHGHILSAAAGIVLLCVAAFCILYPRYNVAFGWIGAGSLVIFLLYPVALKIIGDFEKKQASVRLAEAQAVLRYEQITLRQAAIRYAVNAALVVVAAAMLPEIGAQIASESGLGQTFVGSILMALTSSLPEVVVSMAAVRMGAVDLAIGNLFGSNLFNLFILTIDDLFFLPGPLLNSISSAHVFSAGAAIAMTAISIIGLTYRAERKYWLWGWDSIAMMALFALNFILLFLQTGLD